MSDQEAAPAGLLAALQRLGTHGLELLQLRLSLLGTELEAEKLRLTQALLRMLVVVLMLGVCLAMISVTVLLLCPEAWRWLAALLLAAGFGLGAWLLWRQVQAELSAPGGLFATSLAELQRDRDAMEQR